MPRWRAPVLPHSQSRTPWLNNGCDAGKTLKELQDALDSGELLMGFPLADSTLEAFLDIQQEKRTGRNVLARLPATIDDRKPAIVVGAHVDHLGHGLGTGSWRVTEGKGTTNMGAVTSVPGSAG